MSAFNVISGDRGMNLAARPTLDINVRGLHAISSELAGDIRKFREFILDPSAYLGERSIMAGSVRILAEAGPNRGRCDCRALVGIPGPPCVGPLPPLVSPPDQEGAD